MMTPLLDPEGAKGPVWPATVRSWASGLYLRDQWQLTRKMTASVGLRWEYYPFPTRPIASSSVRLPTNQLQICGIGAANQQLCDIKVQTISSCPGSAWRTGPPTIVIRVGFSRNPQSDNAIRRVGVRANVSADRLDHPVRPTPLLRRPADDRCSARAGAGFLVRRG